MGRNIAVIGAGAWGTTLSLILHGNGARPTLWEAFPEYAALLRSTRENRDFLPGIPLPSDILVTDALDEACGRADAVVIAVPSRFFRAVAARLAPHIAGLPVLIATKGLEAETGLAMSRVLREVAGAVPSAIISGPTIAREIATGHPAAAVIASRRAETAALFQRLLSSDVLRLYTSSDVRGVELGGSLKNVVAIGAGIIDGLGFGTNTKASYLSRGLREMTRLGAALGGRGETFLGLSGLGDLITTSFSGHSRNRSFGQALAEGRRTEHLAATRQAVEGIQTAASLRRLRRGLAVETPIMTSIERILFRDAEAAAEIRRLMRRRLKAER